MLGNQHSHALVLCPLLYLFPSLPLKKLWLWRRQFKENRNANRQPQSNIQTLRHPRRNASGSLKRRRRVSPLVDENHHQDDLAAAAVVVVVMAMTVAMTMQVVVVCLVQGHRGSVCGVSFSLNETTSSRLSAGCIDVF
jgi:hypothetical protein